MKSEFVPDSVGLFSVTRSGARVVATRVVRTRDEREAVVVEIWQDRQRLAQITLTSGPTRHFIDALLHAFPVAFAGSRFELERDLGDEGDDGPTVARPLPVASSRGGASCAGS